MLSCILAVASMLSPPAQVSLVELLSTCVDACSRGCGEIRAVQQKRTSGGKLNVALKDESDARSALTEADVAAQQAIVTALRAEWPGLIIIGEEDDESASAVPSSTELPPLRRDLCSEAMAASGVHASLDDLAIFVDPLDGTREFVEGRLQNVQSLVGIACRGRAIAGAIGLPFASPSADAESGADSPVVYGLVGAGIGLFGVRQPPAAPAASEPASGSALRVTTGDSSNPVLVAATQSALADGGSHQVVGGVGAKILDVVEGRADLAIMHFGSSFWDTCAPGAILSAAGGKTTDLFGSPLMHLPDPPSGNLKNGLGVVASAAGQAEAHDRLCAAMRSDNAALELLQPWMTTDGAPPPPPDASKRAGTGAEAQAADVARCLRGSPLLASTLGPQLVAACCAPDGAGAVAAEGGFSSAAAAAAASAVTLAGYSAAEASAFRGMMSEGCRLSLRWEGAAASTMPTSVFYKRVCMGDLPHARAKALSTPAKLARDVRSYEIEARLLGSKAMGSLCEEGQVKVARAYAVEEQPCRPDPIESKFAMWLQDFDPRDGWRQSGLLNPREARASLRTLARLHAFFWHAPDGSWRRGDAARRELEDAAWGAGGYWQPSMQPREQWTQLSDKWLAHTARFGPEFAAAPAIRHVDLATLGQRLQTVAEQVAAEAHPFDVAGGLADESTKAAFGRFRTLIHGDPKAANLFMRDVAGSGGDGGGGDGGGGAVEVGLIDFQWSGFGLAATDVAHHVAAALSAEGCLSADGARESELLDAYHAELCASLAGFGDAPSAEAAATTVLTRAELQAQYETALLDMCRLVFACKCPCPAGLFASFEPSPHTALSQPGLPRRACTLSPAMAAADPCLRSSLAFAFGATDQWSRADFQTDSLNRNSYNKSLQNAIWLVARCDALLRARGA
jgi:3'-phosphoadenosine 5'-phosphosulfate (PAPS) 3'-phosphatase